jgi:hypothetical protein
MAKLTEAEKRKNFERTVGSSENDMGPLRKDLKAYEDEIMSRPEMKARKNYLEDDRANYQVRKMLAPKDKRVMIPGTVNEADTSSGRLSVMPEYKKGGAIKAKKMSSGGSTASKRADGIAVKGKTRGKIC